MMKIKIFTPLFTTKSERAGILISHSQNAYPDALGGTIFFESKVGKGLAFTTCFHLEKLPINKHPSNRQIPV